MTESQPPRVLVTLKNRAAFDDAYTAGGDHGALWVGDVDCAVGDRVEIELVFVAELMIFHFRGIVDFRDAERGYRVCIAKADRTARDAIVRFVRGKSDADVARRARRFPATLAVEWADGGEMNPGETVDVSSSGTAIRSAVLPAKGSLVAIRFVEHDFQIHGDVVWLSRDPDPRFGVMFMVGEEKKRADVQRLLNAVLEARATTL